MVVISGQSLPTPSRWHEVARPVTNLMVHLVRVLCKRFVSVEREFVSECAGPALDNAHSSFPTHSQDRTKKEKLKLRSEDPFQTASNTDLRHWNIGR
jgi:hypothetical protein